MLGTSNNRQIFGTGYIVLPEGVSRDEYVNSCFNREQFSIVTNDGEYIPNVLATKQVLNDLEIPKTFKQLGTQVLFLNSPDQNRPIIYATLAKKGVSEFRTEDDFISKKTLDGGEVGEVVNTKNHSFVSYIKSFFKKAASYVIQVVGNDKSKFQVESSGWIVLQFEKGIKLRNKDKELRIYEDKLIFTDEYDNKMVIDKDKLMLKNADKKIRLLLDKSGYNFGTINLQDYFDRLLKFFLQNYCLQTAFGPSGFCRTTPSEPLMQQFIQEWESMPDWPDNVH